MICIYLPTEILILFASKISNTKNLANFLMITRPINLLEIREYIQNIR